MRHNPGVGRLRRFARDWNTLGKRNPYGAILTGTAGDLPQWTAGQFFETGRVDVTATVTSHKRRELALEAIVGRFADREGVMRASWRLNPQGS